jgi:hypothetical protein
MVLTVVMRGLLMVLQGRGNNAGGQRENTGESNSQNDFFICCDFYENFPIFPLEMEGLNVLPVRTSARLLHICIA